MDRYAGRIWLKICATKNYQGVNHIGLLGRFPSRERRLTSTWVWISRRGITYDRRWHLDLIFWWGIQPERVWSRSVDCVTTRRTHSHIHKTKLWCHKQRSRVWSMHSRTRNCACCWHQETRNLWRFLPHHQSNFQEVEGEEWEFSTLSSLPWNPNRSIGEGRLHLFTSWRKPICQCPSKASFNG